MKNIGKILLFCLAALWSSGAVAQYYDTGANPDHIRWRLYETDSLRVVAPDYFDNSARRVMHYMDTLSTTIGYGLPITKMLDTPVVIHAENSASNGLSIWAPLRVEIASMPATDSYAQTWLRQLSVHEYRHTAQYSALNQGLIKALRPLLGQQWMLLTSGLMPFWWIEGDATDAETQASAFGRALQPSFTMHYRAVGRDILHSDNPDIWFGGSYNRYIPSHYNLGYQMVSTANTMAQRYVWGDVVDYVSNNPETIFPTEWAMRQKLGYSTEELFRHTFERLNNFWDMLPEREDSAQRVTSTRWTKCPTYTTVRYPLWSDHGTIVTLKGDFDHPQRFVEVEPATGKERDIVWPGAVNSPPTIIDDHIYWTEMSQLSSFAQQIGSVMYKAPVGGGQPKQVLHDSIYALYPTEYDDALAFVRYNFDGTYSIVCIEGEMTMAEGVELHGLCAEGDWLYYLTTSAGGMSIQRVNPKVWRSEVVKPASLATLSSLRVHNGVLYFGSIASGYDEVHAIDIASGKEYRLTTSRYGSFYGAPSPEGEHIALAIYDANGYHLAVDKVVMNEENRIVPNKIPANVVNPPRYKWTDMVRIDDVAFTASDLYDSKEQHPSKPYSKAANLIDFHSWAPIYLRPEQLMSGNLGDVGIGVSATSQNLLSSAFTTVGYRYGWGGKHLASLNLKYVGTPIKWQLSAVVDNQSAGADVAQGVIMKQGDYYASYNHADKAPQPSPTKASYSISVSASLPKVLRHGYWTSTLTPTVEFSHSSFRPYNPNTGEYLGGLNMAAATVQFNSYVRTAVRNVQPRWGFAALGGVGRMLGGFETPTTVGAFVRAYLPGFGLNDGLTLKGSWQGIVGNGPLGYSLDFRWGQPRGFERFVGNYNYWPDDNTSLSLQYSTPLCYPDVGIKGVVLLKRVRLSLFADGLLWRGLNQMGASEIDGMVTVGGDVWLDTSWFRLPAEGDLSLRVSCYADALHRDRPMISVGAGINF